MNIFQTFQNKLAILGPNQSLQTHPLNGRIIFGASIHIITIILKLVYLFREVHNFMDFTKLIYLIGAAVITFMAFLILSFQTEAVFQLIIAIEHLSDGGKFHRS